MLATVALILHEYLFVGYTILSGVGDLLFASVMLALYYPMFETSEKMETPSSSVVKEVSVNSAAVSPTIGVVSPGVVSASMDTDSPPNSDAQLV